MKPRHLLSSSAAALAGLLSISTPLAALADGEGDLKNRVKKLERELDRSRDKLHDAQRELAAKADQIEELKRELEDSKPRVKDSGERKRKAGERKEEERKEEVKSTAKRPPSPPKPGIPARAKKEEPTVKASVPSFSVAYAANSAVNYEAREEALAWAKEQLRVHPEGRLRFEGHANDSKYPEVNRLVATNRARYLSDYLRLSGIPASSIGTVSGAISKAGDPKGKRCEVSLDGPKKEGKR